MLQGKAALFCLFFSSLPPFLPHSCTAKLLYLYSFLYVVPSSAIGQETVSDHFFKNVLTSSSAYQAYTLDEEWNVPGVQSDQHW